MVVGKWHRDPPKVTSGNSGALTFQFALDLAMNESLSLFRKMECITYYIVHGGVVYPRIVERIEERMHSIEKDYKAGRTVYEP